MCQCTGHAPAGCTLGGWWWVPGVRGMGGGADSSGYPWYGSGVSLWHCVPLYLHCGTTVWPVLHCGTTVWPCTPLYGPVLHCMALYSTVWPCTPLSGLSTPLSGLSTPQWATVHHSRATVHHSGATVESMEVLVAPQWSQWRSWWHHSGLSLWRLARTVESVS